MSTPLRDVSDQTFFDRVDLDGVLFRNVIFDGAELVFSGGAAPAFDRCRFLDCTFTFDGPAGETVGFLRALSGANPDLRQVVLDLLPALTG